MKISRDNSVAPLIIIDDFLTPEKAAEVLAECIILEPVYHQAGVISKNPGTIGQGGLIDKSIRKNEALFVDRIFEKNTHKSKILKNVYDGNFKKRLKDLWREDDSFFDIINYANRFETVVSRYGDGDFYKYHVDSNGVYGNRVVTAVYYIQKENAPFTGGDIFLKRGDKEINIKPLHNRLIVFKSDTLHRVDTVNLPGNKWDDGRFSINIWIGFRQ